MPPRAGWDYLTLQLDARDGYSSRASLLYYFPATFIYFYYSLNNLRKT